MDEYLIDLIHRMNETSDQKMEAGHDTSKIIAWKALREAENLESEKYALQLIDFIEKEKDKKKRDSAYFVLGHIAKNRNIPKAVNFLIQSINKESDKYIVFSLLDRIANVKKSTGTDLQPIIDATKSEKWQIRHSAIRALNLSVDESAETALIEIIDSTQDPYDISYANGTLNRIGTPKAISSLEKHLMSRKRDVKDSAKFAINEIKKRNGLK